MPISFVGSHVGTHAATTAQTVNFSSLRNSAGGTPTVDEFDLVVVAVQNATAGVNRGAGALVPAGYTAAHTALFNTDTNASNFQVSYKWMGATPDTSVAIPASNATTSGVAYAIYVFHGVHPTNPLDVTPTTAGAGNTGVANAPAITPVTAGAWIAAFGGAAVAAGAVFTNPAGMSTTTNHFRSATITTTTNDANIGGALFTTWTSGAYDPAAFGGSTTTNTGSWSAVTLALRPKPPSLLVGDTTGFTVATTDTAFKYIPALGADVQTFNVAQVDASVEIGRQLVADSTPFSATFLDAGVSWLDLTGYEFAADSRPYAVGALDTGFRASRRIVFDRYAGLAGAQDAVLSTGKILVADQSAITAGTGSNVNLIRTVRLVADAIAYSASTIDAQASAARRIPIDRYAATITAVGANLTTTRQLTIDRYAAVAGAVNANTLRGIYLAADAQNYTVTTVNAGRNLSMVAQTSAVIVDTPPDNKVVFGKYFIIDAPVTFSLGTGGDVAFRLGRRVTADSRTYAALSQSADLVYARNLVMPAISMAINLGLNNTVFNKGSIWTIGPMTTFVNAGQSYIRFSDLPDSFESATRPAENLTAVRPAEMLIAYRPAVINSATEPTANNTASR